ncbi:p21-C-terminal region-binding protein-domain-containing protein [Chlamydoabsidia padenii]|nr:p21-C-terminal region-binding protein-domain-containing protein [Chlamydoabsidia padenii]
MDTTQNNKRKTPQEEPTKKQDDSSDEDSDGTLQDIIDVDFDFYNPEEVDYHALKRLLGQLFSSDVELIQVGDLVDIIIEENQVGTTIKVDGQESDPYAILSVINLQEQKANKGVASLCHYLSNKCPKKDQALHKAIMKIFSLEKPVGWIVSERFINMPVDVMPPMYNLLLQETKKAVENNEPYDFEWYMFIVKVYKEVAPTVDNEEEEEEDDEPPAKKKKGKKASRKPTSLLTDETIYYQAEDEIIASYATYQYDYKFTNSDKESVADAKHAFSDIGIAPSRKLLLVHHSKFAHLVDEIEKTCSTPMP